MSVLKPGTCHTYMIGVIYKTCYVTPNISQVSGLKFYWHYVQSIKKNNLTSNQLEAHSAWLHHIITLLITKGINLNQRCMGFCFFFLLEEIRIKAL